MMKWRNIDSGAAYYHITSTFTAWLPLFRHKAVLLAVVEEIGRSLDECRGSIAAYVFMPDHLHILVYLPEEGLLHRFCKLWRGRSSKRITSFLHDRGDSKTLSTMAAHASGGAARAVWKEQVRALAVHSSSKLREKVDYIHANPVRRELVKHPDDWPYSSWRFYEGDGRSLLPITPWEP